MINSTDPHASMTEPDEEAVLAVVHAGPGGALILAGITAAMVVAMWFAFYLLVFVPRGTP